MVVSKNNKVEPEEKIWKHSFGGKDFTITTYDEGYSRMCGPRGYTFEIKEMEMGSSGHKSHEDALEAAKKEIEYLNK